MRIVIVGPGAIGCLFAAALSKTKEEVWLLDKHKERAAKISDQGIRVEGISGNWTAKVRIAANPKDIPVADLLIITVKSYDTKNAIVQAKPIIGSGTKILTLQNGIGNIEIIAEAVGDEAVIGGITSQGATLLGEGNIRHAGKGETIIGRLDGKMPVEMRAIRELFNKAGFDTKVTRDLKSILWSKLIINVGINPLTALTRLPNGQLLNHEGTRNIMRKAVTEAVRVAKRKRIRLIYDDPLAKVEAVCEATAANVSSMLQDILRKKATEIDFINGVIVRLAQELGIDVPVNSILVDLVKSVEDSYCVQKTA